MKGFIKLILLVIIVGFALINYRIFTFTKGFSKREMEDKNLTEVISTITGINKIEYYKKTIADDKYIYNVFIETNTDAYLLSATQEEIDSFSVLSIFSEKLKPEKISPIPFYVEIVLGLLILIIPFGKRS